MNSLDNRRRVTNANFQKPKGYCLSGAATLINSAAAPLVQKQFFSDCIMELDSMLVAEMLKNKNSNNLNVKSIIEDIINYIDNRGVAITHCYREAKGVADFLAKLVTTIDNIIPEEGLKEPTDELSNYDTLGRPSLTNEKSRAIIEKSIQENLVLSNDHEVVAQKWNVFEDPLYQIEEMSCTIFTNPLYELDHTREDEVMEILGDNTPGVITKDNEHSLDLFLRGSLFLRQTDQEPLGCGSPSTVLIPRQEKECKSLRDDCGGRIWRSKSCATPTTTIQDLVDDLGLGRQHAGRGQEKRSDVQLNTWEDNAFVKWETYLKGRPVKLLAKLWENSSKEKPPKTTSHAKGPKCLNPSNLRTNSSQEEEIDGNKGLNLTPFVKFIIKGSMVKILSHGPSVKGQELNGIWGGPKSIMKETNLLLGWKMFGKHQHDNVHLILMDISRSKQKHSPYVLNDMIQDDGNPPKKKLYELKLLLRVSHWIWNENMDME
ncbi:hypothetical protein RND71_018325 [Anisodus tanguticus]|uniref:RNase H type-1 domain-containing protein n=1 Tax=Anisodus tanguticus TaxID=243964 RepID=A0AAE1VJ85_9SOLA|nr:hypothetical protein RND71_018325 [Anisodus tanguticus]